MSLRLRALFLISILSVVTVLTPSGFAELVKKRPANRVIASNVMPDFIPESPESEYTRDEERMKLAFAQPNDPGMGKIPTIDFCSDWNPEFAFNGHRCCRSLASVRARKTRVSCFSRHHLGGFCAEMTDEQREYQKEVQSGKAGDVLDLITQEMGRKDQAYCTANNGFLAHGRPLVPTATNRILLRDSSRCTQFGTDNMIGMLEWLGRTIASEFSSPEYAGVHLLMGDISAPRGGCLSGASGVHGHLSHTNGSDADVGLLNVRANAKSPTAFSNDFDPRQNWWMIRQIMKNPYACVKVIFLDKHHIRKLAKFAARDEQWPEYRRFLRHQKGHRNHMHVRIGDHPGPPGCAANPHPELEEGTDSDESDTISI